MKMTRNQARSWENNLLGLNGSISGKYYRQNPRRAKKYISGVFKRQKRYKQSLGF